MCKTATETYTNCPHVDFIPVSVHSEAPYCGKQQVVDLGISKTKTKCSDCTKVDKLSDKSGSEKYELAPSPKPKYEIQQDVHSRTNIDGMVYSQDPTASVRPRSFKKYSIPARHLRDPSQVRFWRQKNGIRPLEGAFIELTAENEVKARRIDGKKFSIKAMSLCHADLEYVENETHAFFGDEFFVGDDFEEAPPLTDVASPGCQKKETSIDKQRRRSIHAYSDIDEVFGRSDLSKAILMSPDTKRKNTIMSRAASLETPAEVEQVPFTTADPKTNKLYTVPFPIVSPPAEEGNVSVTRKRNENHDPEAESLMQNSDVAKEYHEAADYSETDDFPAFADAAIGVESTTRQQLAAAEPRAQAPVRTSSDEAQTIHPDFVHEYLRAHNMTRSTSFLPSPSEPDATTTTTDEVSDHDWEPIHHPLDHSLAGVLKSAGTAPNGDGGMSKKLQQLLSTQASQIYKAAEPHVKGAVKAGKKVISEKVLTEVNKAWFLSGFEKGFDVGRAAVGRPPAQTRRRLI